MTPENFIINRYDDVTKHFSKEDKEVLDAYHNLYVKKETDKVIWHRNVVDKAWVIGLASFGLGTVACLILYMSSCVTHVDNSDLRIKLNDRDAKLEECVSSETKLRSNIEALREDCINKIIGER